MRKEVFRAEALRKAYGDLCILKDISFHIFEGETLVVIGANGAGKSSLSKIISGNEPADGGSLYFAEQLIDRSRYTIRRAKELGIHYISASHELVGDYTVAENILLPYKKYRIYSRKKTEALAAPYMRQVTLTCPPGQLASELTVEEQFKVKLASALAGSPRLLILDEPPLLSFRSRDFFDRIIKSYTVMLITHNLNEAFSYADRIMVLRDGIIVCVERKEDLNINTLYNVMSVSPRPSQTIRLAPPVPKEDLALEVSHLTTPALRDVSFQARRGEILGLIGYYNSGKTSVLDTLYGLIPWYRGTITVNGRILQLTSPKTARRNGIVYSPWEHTAPSLIPDLRVLENLSLFELPRVSSKGFINQKLEQHFSGTYLRYLFNDKITCQTPVDNLSYGTIHKIQLAQCLSTHAKILLLNEPIDGMDLESKEKIIETLLEQAANGACILIAASLESSDIINICNRMLAFSEGALLREFSQNTFHMKELLSLIQRGDKQNHDTNNTIG